LPSPAKYLSFCERNGLWNPERAAAAAELEADVKRAGVETIRLVFADQHGILRGKTLMAADLPRLLREGCGAPSSLLLKDTANRTVFTAFARGAGVGLAEMQGAADVLMIPDPSTFKVLPWSPKSGWLLCDLRFPNGAEVAFSSRDLMRRALGALSAQGFDFVAGAELEFHLFKRVDAPIAPMDAAQPGAPTKISLFNTGFQYLSELRYDALEIAMSELRAGLQGLGLPLASLEIEYGPCQCEMTFKPLTGLAAADLVMLARSAVKQIATRNGWHATFMCRPRIQNIVSSGWHLHQSLRNSTTGENAFTPISAQDALSDIGKHYLAGLLRHADAAASFSTPTINGYKRYRAYTNAPDRAVWGRDNRGAMARVISGPNDPASRVENRIGEPAANPYLYMTSQIVSGLDGVARKLDPGPSADAPYESKAPSLPRSLDEALTALDASACMREGFGDAFVNYWLHIKRSEIDRFNAEVTEWEHREYFDMY
jgi:glutamine synthetase